jgi:hypothetical protein
MIDRDADTLRREFERAAEGATLGVAWCASAQYFAGLIASTAMTIGHAEQLVDAAADDLKSTIRRNWREARSV